MKKIIKKKGFTLIEILTVIILLSLLLTLIATKGFGVFNKLKGKIDNESLNTVKEATNLFLVDVKNCDDDNGIIDDYIKAKDINENEFTCAELKDHVKTNSITITNLKDMGYLDENIEMEVTIKISDDYKVTVTPDSSKFELADVNKDGLINYYDYIEIDKIVKSKQKLTSSTIKKYDVNEDGKVDDDDTELLLEKLKSSAVLGDINRNGILDKQDADLILKIAVGTINENAYLTYLADYDENGGVTAADASDVLQEIKSSILGDVDGNGLLQKNDADLILKYVVGSVTFTDEQKKLADYDNDGYITADDSAKIKTFYTNNPLKGDVNLDGNLDTTDFYSLLSYIDGGTDLKSAALNAADFNLDGKITEVDLDFLIDFLDKYGQLLITLKGDINGNGILDKQDADLILKIAVGTINENAYLTYLADYDENGGVTSADASDVLQEIKSSILGDVDGNGLLQKNDADLILEYVAGSVTFTDEQKKLADYDNDGYITADDSAKIKTFYTNNPLKGDVNLDGKFDINDVYSLLSYIDGGTDLKSAALNAADFNLDGEITLDDLDLLTSYAFVNDDSIINLNVSILKGDINGNGILDKQDAYYILSFVSKNIEITSRYYSKIADVNGDKTIDISDSNIINNTYNSNPNLGDVNKDGLVNKKDVELISQYLDGKTTLDNNQLELADMNQDNKVTTKDTESINKFYTNNPLKGDVNLDGLVNKDDLILLKDYLNGNKKFDKYLQYKAADFNLDYQINAEDKTAINNYINN